MGQPAAKKQKLDFSNSFTVHVGTERKQYMLHTSFATKTSGFFRIAANGRWKESKDNKLTLPDVRPSTFEVYLEWLYTDKIVLLETETGRNPDGTPKLRKGADTAYPQLLRLYCLAQYLLDLTFQNTVIDHLIKSVLHFKVHPGVSDVKTIWPLVPDNSPIK
ncbi:uncharacterized protein LTR77_011096 [Saxophila tyrrhenica]|uniref:BTB domain-containing protein n=1 Tax=Saxophila tyrrhenica TaxID=1690608 RepID=A0AAV9NTW4_9PEZI|nr:hypothetical protein LTR77_011096 [Saxophila tyrrhenica]